jgi:hypothetical protein
VQRALDPLIQGAGRCHSAYGFGHQAGQSARPRTEPRGSRVEIDGHIGDLKGASSEGMPSLRASLGAQG